MINGRIEHIRESLESMYYLQVEIVFTNTDQKICKIKHYTLVWPEGTVTIKADNLVVPPHASLSRNIRIMPDQTDLKSMYRHADDILVHIDRSHYQ